MNPAAVIWMGLLPILFAATLPRTDAESVAFGFKSVSNKKWLERISGSFQEATGPITANRRHGQLV